MSNNDNAEDHATMKLDTEKLHALGIRKLDTKKLRALGIRKLDTHALNIPTQQELIDRLRNERSADNGQEEF